MPREETVQELISIVREELCLDETAEINGESRFAALMADYMDVFAIVYAVEQKRGLTFRDYKKGELVTLNDLAEWMDHPPSSPLPAYQPPDWIEARIAARSEARITP